MADQKFFYKDLTYGIIGAAPLGFAPLTTLGTGRTGIGAAMEVHKVLGPGFLESVYEEALAHEFDPSTSSGHRLRGISYQRQARLAVRYKEIVAGEFRADSLVDGKVVVELKAVKALTEGDEAQLLNYPSTGSGQASRALVTGKSV